MTSPLEDAAAELRRAQDALETAQQQLAAAHDTAKAKAGEVIAQVREMRPAEPGPERDAFLKQVGRLYWDMPFVSAAELRKAAGYSSHQEFLRAIGPAPSGVSCATCGKDIPRTSRSSRTHENHTWAGSPICSDCYRLADAERSRQHNVQELRKHFVETSPVIATARDWSVATALVLAYPPVSTGVEPRTEMDWQTGTWWRFRRAQELEARLVGRSPESTTQVPYWLAKEVISSALTVAGWDTARTREIVDPITDDAAQAVLSRLDNAAKRVKAERTVKGQQVYPDDYVPTSEENDRVREERNARYLHDWDA